MHDMDKMIIIFIFAGQRKAGNIITIIWSLFLFIHGDIGFLSFTDLFIVLIIRNA